MKCLEGYRGVEGECSLLGNLHFGTTHMLLLEEELPVQVAHINGVQVNLERAITVFMPRRCALFRTYSNYVLEAG